MKNNQIIAALTGVFVLCAVYTMFKAWNYHVYLKRLTLAQDRANAVRMQLRPMLFSLMNDTTEYSKKNPAVLPILQALTNDLNKPHAAPAPRTK